VLSLPTTLSLSDAPSLPMSRRNSSSRNSVKMVPIQLWISVGPPGRAVSQ
jgi:hypothetical protein